MDHINKRKSVSQPSKQNKVIFFYIKPLQKQQQQVYDPQINALPQKNKNCSIFSYCQDQTRIIQTLDHKSNFDIKSDDFSLQTVSISFEKTKRKYLDDFVFMSNLGKGTYGRVQKLRGRQDNMIYAGKTLLKSYNSNTNKYKNKKLQTQIKIYSKLSHPNFPQLHQIYTWKNEYTLIMEYVKGQSLHSILQNHPNNQPLIAHVIYQIIDALDHMHSMKIVHHDIKPENILYDPKTEIVKIVDFGESIILNEDMEIVQKQGGTFAYFAPQIFNKQCSAKLDIWACGVILYYLLDGRVYFNQSSKDKIKQNIETKKVQFPGYNWTKRSPQVKDLILKMLDRNPQSRISAKQAKNHQWILQNCQNWSNPTKNPMQNSIRSLLRSSIRNSKTLIIQKDQSFKSKEIDRKFSYDMTNLNFSKSCKKMSRFCNNNE